MLFRFGTFVAALSLQTTFAAPTMETNQEPQLEDLQCHCLTFRTNDRPTPCNFFESNGFSWRSAQTIASENDIRILFASKSTISKVLSVDSPLPSDVLQIISRGDAESVSKGANMEQNKIVCGFGGEVRYMTRHYRSHEPESHFVGPVIGWLMIFIALYVVGEYFWTRYSSQGRAIKLKGEEKPLKARFRNQSNANLEDAPSNFP